MNFRLLSRCLLVGASALMATAAVNQPAGQPDLVITDFTWSPKHPKIGDEVHFQATIKNIGTAPTPEGVTTGVAFGVGHTEPILWSDTHKESIAPGQSITVTPNGGRDNRTTWTATSGFHDGIWVIANDARRYAEPDFYNNMGLYPFAVRGDSAVPERYKVAKPDLVIKDFHWIPEHPKAGDKLTIEVTVKNQGSAATPAGKTLGVGFYILYYNTAVLYTNTDVQSLGPGQEVTLRTNGGGFGCPWLPPVGTYAITADVNDTGAIDESDVENNMLRKYVTVADTEAPADIIKRSHKLTGAVFGHSESPEPPWLEYKNAFDGDVGTCYMTDDGKEMYVGIDLGADKATPISAIRFYPKPYEEADMAGGEFQGSNDGPDTGFETLYRIPEKPASNWNLVPISNPKAYRYLRYRAADGSHCLVNEIEFYSAQRS